MIGLPKGFSDDKLCITNTGHNSPSHSIEEVKSRIKETVLSEKSKQSQDPEYMEKQIEELKALVKDQTRTLKEKGNMLPNRPEFPIRF